MSREDADPATQVASDIAADTVTIVAIGASAGGIRALEEFFRHAPANTGLAYVVIQHASPTVASTLAEILQRVTSLPVQDITHDMEPGRDRIHIRPPGTILELRDGRLQLSAPSGPRDATNPIDVFFASLATGLGQVAAGVILSGSGNDGTAGARALRAAGGLIAAQEPATAMCDSMPRSVVQEGLAHLIAPLANLPERIIADLARPTRRSLARTNRVVDALPQILQALKTLTGHDFTTYKISTLVRRIERRMNLRQIEAVDDYVLRLSDNPLEARMLVREFLIGVTSFFRDPDVWAQVKAEVIPALLAAHPDGGVIRAWIPGCATGEDAYSLAMIMTEVMASTAAQTSPYAIQIFATDLNPLAIEKARRGIYPAAIATAVDEARLAQFFVPHEHGYRVTQALRELITFAPHSLLSDPPFTRIDLLICRNLLIYLDPHVHDILLPRFHYSLNPRGHLVLGSSESIGSSIDLFSPLTGNRQIYRRIDVPCQPRRLGFATRSVIAQAPSLAAPSAEPMNPDDLPLPATISQLLLQRFGPAALVLNVAGEVLHLCGRIEPFLTATVDRDGSCTISLVRDGLREVLHDGLHEVLHSQQTLRRRAEFRIAEGSPQAVDLIIQPLRAAENLSGLVLVIFTEDLLKFDTSAATPDAQQIDQQTTRIRALEHELRSTRHELQLAREEMQASREELTSTNEELQSTNEELTTSAEELRTMNEELVRARAAAEQSLARYTDLFDSAPVGYFTIDRKGTIIQANAAGAGLLGMEQERLTGGPLGLFVKEVDRTIFRDCLNRAFASDTAQVCEVSLWREDAPPRIIRISALAAADGLTCRMVAADVSEIRQTEATLRERDETLRLTITASRLGLWQWDIVPNTLEWSPECKRMFGLAPDAEVTFALAHSLIHPDDREATTLLTRQTLDSGRDLTNEHRVVWPDGSTHWVAVLGRVYRNADGKPLRMVGVTIDITERKEAEKILRLERAKLETAFENMAMAVFLMDGKGDNLWMNGAGRRLLGVEPGAPAPDAETGHIAAFDLLDATGRVMAAEEWPAIRAMRGDYVQDVPISIRHRQSGRQRACYITVMPVRDAEGTVTQLVCTVNDVTERKAAEEAHRTSLAIIKNLELALDEHALVSIADQAGRIIYANDKFCTVSKYSREELLGQDHRIINSGHHSHEFMRDLRETLFNGRTWKGAICNRAKDGSLYWVDTTIVPFRSADGTPYQYVAIRNDITQRREAEAKLAQNQRFLKAVTDGFPGLVAYWTRELRCTFANKAYLNWFGRQPEQVIGMTMQDLLGSETFEAKRPHIENVLRGMTQVFHRTQIKADGETGYLLAQLIPDIDEGSTKGFYVLLSDITAIRQAEQALRRSTELLQSSQSLAQVGGWELDIAQATVFWTGETHRIHETDHERYVPTVDHWITLYHGANGEQFRNAIQLATTAGEDFDQELELVGAKRSRKWVHITSQVITESDRPVKIIGAIQDITERRRLQIDLSQARDKALEASRLKSEFLSTMSHEIRTPMNGVIGVTELLLGTELDASQQEIVEILRNSGENLLVIINDILDFSKIEAGKFRIDSAIFSLRTVIAETIALLAPRAREKGIVLRHHVAAVLAEAMRGDGGRIRQVVINLVGNALKFTDHGEVSIDATLISEREGWRTIRVAVTDTGAGIPPDLQSRLFQPFTQGDGSFTRKHGGTGLGLAISRQLIELMGGSIGFTSLPGSGSTFWFELPLATKDQSGVVTPESVPPTNHGEQRLRVLVADDNPANQRVAKLMLTSLGHEVEMCTDGAQALRRLAEARFDAVLLDCQMPIMDGYETARRIRAGAIPGIDRHIPLIALTAAAMPEDRTLTREVGMNDHLTKPIRPNELDAAFRRIGLLGEQDA